MPFFHLYGLLIGLAIVAALGLIEYQARRHRVDAAVIWSAGWWVLLSGVVGARFYHVATDFQFYQADWLGIVRLWQGGLGIIGGVAGGMLGLILWAKVRQQSWGFIKTWLDLSVFGLPLAQAIGRLGNYFNQELYGLPTTLPWGIEISKQFRPVEYAHLTNFHPLFAYEALLMILFGLVIWLIDLKQQLNIGTGRLFLIYVGYYAMIRFGLEFLRINRHTVWWILDINQIVVLILMIICVCFLEGLSFFERVVFEPVKL